MTMSEPNGKAILEMLWVRALLTDDKLEVK